MDSSQANPEISIVVPLYNEEQNIPELYIRLTDSVKFVTENYEVVFVNDGSIDNTLALIKGYAENDSHIRYISFSRNFGHQNSIAAGIHYAKGNTLITMDGDLQDPPELIKDLYQKFRDGYKVVYARRASRKGESFFKKFTAKVFYRMMKRITSIDIPLDTGDFRLISKEVAGKLKKMDEANKFLRGQIAWLGYKAAFIEFERPDRKLGNTKYTLRKMIRFAFDGITSFSNFPLQIATLLGFVFSLVAFVIIIYALYSNFILNRVVPGWTSLMISTMFIGGIQLLCIGIIGEYILRIGNDVKKRPAFIIEESNIANEAE